MPFQYAETSDKWTGLFGKHNASASPQQQTLSLMYSEENFPPKMGNNHCGTGMYPAAEKFGKAYLQSNSESGRSIQLTGEPSCGVLKELVKSFGLW